MLNIDNEFILITGSISKKTEKAVIDDAHDFIRKLTKTILDARGGLVVYLAGEPCNADGDSLTFDWTVVNEFEKLRNDYSPTQQLKIITSDLALQEKMTEEKRKLIRTLRALNFADIIKVPDELITGGNIGDEQVDVATAMIALGGGKGVTDRARKMSKRKVPIFPLDLKLGGFSEDGLGALGLLNDFKKNPLSMFPFTGNQVNQDLEILSLQEPTFAIEELTEKIIKIFQTEFEAKRASRTPDILILTALAIELAAAKLVFEIDDDIQPRISSNGIHFWSTSLSKYDGQVSCVIASIGNAGNVKAASITSQLLTELQPKKVLMMGIAAGERGKMTLGEVIFSERIVYYEGATAKDDEPAPRPEVFALSQRTEQNINTYLSHSTLSDRLQKLATLSKFVIPNESAAGEVATQLIVSPATIASGELLVRDGKFFEKIKKIHDKICVAEMEGYGVFDACNRQDVPALVIRGISDYGDKSKDQTFHKIASVAAAIVTKDYVLHGWR